MGLSPTPHPHPPNFSLFPPVTGGEKVRVNNTDGVRTSLPPLRPPSLPVSLLPSLCLCLCLSGLPSRSLGPKLNTQPHPRLCPRAGATRSCLSRDPRSRDCVFTGLSCVPPQRPERLPVRGSAAHSSSPQRPQARQSHRCPIAAPAPQSGARRPPARRGPPRPRLPGGSVGFAHGCTPFTGEASRPGASLHSSNLHTLTWVPRSRVCPHRCKGSTPLGER